MSHFDFSEKGQKIRQFIDCFGWFVNEKWDNLKYRYYDDLRWLFISEVSLYKMWSNLHIFLLAKSNSAKCLYQPLEVWNCLRRSKYFILGDEFRGSDVPLRVECRLSTCEGILLWSEEILLMMLLLPVNIVLVLSGRPTICARSRPRWSHHSVWITTAIAVGSVIYSKN